MPQAGPAPAPGPTPKRFWETAAVKPPVRPQATEGPQPEYLVQGKEGLGDGSLLRGRRRIRGEKVG